MLSDRSPLRLLTVMRHQALVLNYRVRLLWRGRNVTRREWVPYLFRIFGMRFAEAAPHEAARRGSSGCASLAADHGRCRGSVPCPPPLQKAVIATNSSDQR
jgi:hypothetical protein